MHCGVDFDADAPGAATVDGRADSVRTAGERGGTIEPGPSPNGDSGEHSPDPLRRSLVVLIGILGGAVVGILTLLLFAMFAQDGGGGVVASGVVWIAGTGYIATRDSVREAFRDACYAVGVLLVLLPLVAFSSAAQGGNLAGRFVLFLSGELIFGLVALVVAGTGYAVGS